MDGSGIGWSELPGELLEMVEGNLGLYDDKIRFSCVCTHFMQSVSDDLPDLRRPQPPWLLLPYKTGSMCGLYHPFEKKVFDIDLPEAGDKVFIGNCHGWVVTTQQNGSIDVLNPLTRVRVPLPPRYKFPDVLQYHPDKVGEEYLFKYDGYMAGVEGFPNPPFALSSKDVRDGKIEKIVLSSSPLSDDFIAVAVYSSGTLAYCTVGDSEWCDLLEFGDNDAHQYRDVTFFEGKLYVLSHEGEMMVCDDIRSCPRLRECDSIPPLENLVSSDNHLTTWSNGLMVIMRYEEIRQIGSCEDLKYAYSSDWFVVYKLDVYSGSGWVRTRSLDDDESLFMGVGAQMGFSDTSEGNGNRVYFASDRLYFGVEDVEDCFDNGVFNFEDARVQPLGYECNPRVIWPSPIWVTPHPY